MSILVYAENWNGKFKKSTFEVVSYAKEIAKTLNQELNAITIGEVVEEEFVPVEEYPDSGDDEDDDDDDIDIDSLFG